MNEMIENTCLLVTFNTIEQKIGVKYSHGMDASPRCRQPVDFMYTFYMDKSYG